MVQVTVERVGLDQDADQAVVLLADLTKTTVVPIWIRPLEASAIALPLQGLKAPRPLTADLLLDVVGKLDAEIVMITVDDVRDGTFYATLVVARDGEPMEIDCRPSDAIAVALRASAPIYVAESILVEVGVNTEEGDVQ